MPQSWPVPYVPDIANLHPGAFVAFCVSVLLVVLVNAEAQAFMATLLGDRRIDAKDRFHFNVFLHLDLLGTINFFLGGYGWAKQIAIDPSRFSHPRFYTVLTRLAGPIANFILANIAASIVGILHNLEVGARVPAMVAGVNLTTFVYNLIPLPPLVAGVLLTTCLPARFTGLRWALGQAGPYLILALTLLDRLYPAYSFRPWLDDLVRTMFGLICGR